MTINAEIYDGTQVSTGRRKPSDLVAEYEAKVEAVPAALEAFAAAQADVMRAATIGGTHSGMTLKTGSISAIEMQRSLLQSAWRHCWATYNLADIASADMKRRVDRMFEQPPAFTVAEIRAQFGDLIADPWASILRGLAEVFAGLDPAFKSHEKMKIGVAGLPKRVVLSNVNDYGSYGRDKLRDILNALAAYQRKPLAEYQEVSALLDDGESMRSSRDVWLKRFHNGNGHLFFGPDALRDVNRALAEFYGDVLPDTPDEATKKQASTAVAKDLQFYPTPAPVVDRLMNVRSWHGLRVLEPSCGDGAILDGLRANGADAFGIEVDAGRAQAARNKGHAVLCANFLEQPPSADFDAVAMNPPFYGRHYAKHIRHALRFLKPGGRLYSILPATARYDHGELDDLHPRWIDLPVGSFSASGTNINTCIAEVTA